MEKHDLNSWDEFPGVIRDIRQQYGTIPPIPADEPAPARQNRLLFRGHADSDWPFRTTLERKSKTQYDVLGYLLTATSCANELESFTGKRWNIPSREELIRKVENDQDSFRVSLPCYDFLVYLRHHGFPSPLLDWSVSPYIAAYFAYCDEPVADRVAVYAYVEKLQGGQPLPGDTAKISVQGPSTTTDVRHFTQKAWYSIATCWSAEERRHHFCPHQDVFATAGDDRDLLIAITLPAAERAAVLRDLNDYNINHFSLLQSEDSLVKTMTMKCFDLASP